MTDQNTAPEVKWGEWIGGGWQMLTQRWQVWVPMMLVFIVALLVPILPAYILMIGASLASQGDEPSGVGAGLGLLAGLAGGLVTMCLAAFMMGGLYRTAFKQMRGESISIGDLFSGKDLMVNMLITTFLVGLCAMAGALLCVLPAYIVVGLLMFAIPLVVERGLSPFDALKTSFEKTKGNWLMFTLFAFVVGLIAGSGAFACYIGMLATYPLHFLITAVAYRDVFGVAGAGGGMGAPPSSYASPSWQQGAQSYMPPPPQFTPPQTPQSYAPQQAPPQAPPSFMPPPAREIAPPPTAVVPPPASMTADQKSCPHCKAVLMRTANFCNYCGKPLQS